MGLTFCPAGGFAAPANDQFTDRIALAGSPVLTFGSSTNATKEIGEPNHAGNPGGHSVWWSWIAPANGDVILTTDGSDFDTLLGVYTGSAPGSLSLVASNDDHGGSFINGVFTNSLFSTSRVRFQALAGIQYQIAVDGFNDGTNAASGNITLSLSFTNEPIARPANDQFTNRIALVGSSVVTNSSNVSATRETAEPYHAARIGETSVWWTWTAPASDYVKVSTDGSPFDTVLAIYTGSTLSNLVPVASNDDEDPANAILTSAVTFNATQGTVYQIVVDGFDGASGPISLRIEPVRTRLSAPEILPDGNFQFVLSGLPGKTFDLEASANSGPWNPIGSVSSSSGTMTIVDLTATNYTTRLYRARMNP